MYITCMYTMILNSVFPFSHFLPKHTAIRPPSQPLVAQVNEELFKSQPQRFRHRYFLELGSVKKHQGLLFIQYMNMVIVHPIIWHQYSSDYLSD